jgi:hypothetical protein
MAQDAGGSGVAAPERRRTTPSGDRRGIRILP